MKRKTFEERYKELLKEALNDPHPFDTSSGQTVKSGSPLPSGKQQFEYNKNKNKKIYILIIWSNIP